MAEVLSRVAKRNTRLKSLSVEARLVYKNGERTLKQRAVILAQRPASLHYSVLSPTDELLAVLVSDGERFTSFKVGRMQCFTGRNCVENTEHFGFFPLESGHLVETVLGGTPLIWARKTSLSWDEDEQAYRVELIGSRKVTQSLWISDKSWAVRRTEIRRAGALEISIEFDDVSSVKGLQLPQKILMKMPQRKSTLQIQYHSASLNTPIKKSAFQLACPVGTSEQTLLCYEELPKVQKPRDSIKWSRPKAD